MICVTLFCTLRESESTRTCENCTRFASKKTHGRELHAFRETRDCVYLFISAAVTKTGAAPYPRPALAEGGGGPVQSDAAAATAGDEDEDRPSRRQRQPLSGAGRGRASVSAATRAPTVPIGGPGDVPIVSDGKSDRTAWSTGAHMSYRN